MLRAAAKEACRQTCAYASRKLEVAPLSAWEGVEQTEAIFLGLVRGEGEMERERERERERSWQKLAKKAKRGRDCLLACACSLSSGAPLKCGCGQGAFRGFCIVASGASTTGANEEVRLLFLRHRRS